MAEPEVIQAAYRRLASKYHPDVSSGPAMEADTRMKELNAAYSVLSDPALRADYDVRRSGSTQRGSPPAAARPGRPRFRVAPEKVEINDVDPEFPVVRVIVRLHQIGGEPFDPQLHFIDFTLRAPYNRALLTDIALTSTGPILDVSLTLDLSFMRREPGWSHVGIVNVKGDPAASFLLIVTIGAHRAHLRTEERVVGSAAQRNEADPGPARPAGSIWQFGAWLARPATSRPGGSRSLRGLSGRAAAVAALILVGAILVQVLIGLFQVLLQVIAVVAVLALIAVAASSLSGGGQKSRKRRR